MADASSELPSEAGRYAAATEVLRSTAKWLLASFAGIGAALVAGLQLTGIGALGRSDLVRLAAAVLSLLITLGAVGYMIRETSFILTAEWVTLAELTDASFAALLAEGNEKKTTARKAMLEQLRTRIDDAAEELYAHVAASIAELHKTLREANEAARKSVALSASEQQEALGRARELRAVAKEVADCANYHRTVMLFRNLKKGLAGAAVIAALGAIVFAYAITPEKPTEPLKVEIQRPQP